MNFIKNIFEGHPGEEAHIQFMRFSRGEFKNRAVVVAKQSKGKYTISTTPEFANGLVRSVAAKLGSSKTLVEGAIISTNDLTGEIDFQEKKQFQGVKRYILKQEFSGDEIIDLLDRFPKSFFGLSFKAEKDDTTLKIKPKAPKSGKPSSKGEEKPKPGFCRLTTFDKELGESFVLEKKDWKKAEINHTFKVSQLVAPEGEKDFAKMRELAKRKGIIYREATIDEKTINTEIPFEV